MALPRARGFDRSLLFLRDGDDCIGKQVLCMRGAPAAQLFYASGRFTLAGAMVFLRVSASAQLLEGEPHCHRRPMLLDLPRLRSKEHAAKPSHDTRNEAARAS
jgi:fatty-acid peroxygenase